MGHQSYVLLCSETTVSNPPVVFPKSSCDVHLLRRPCFITLKVFIYSNLYTGQTWPDRRYPFWACYWQFLVWMQIPSEWHQNLLGTIQMLRNHIFRLCGTPSLLTDLSIFYVLKISKNCHFKPAFKCLRNIWMVPKSRKWKCRRWLATKFTSNEF